MVWLKSLGVALLVVLGSIPIGFLILGRILKVRSGLPSISIDILSLSRNLVVWLVLLLAFVLGFLWEYHRLTS